MSGQSASTPAEPADHPLRAALARGDRLHAHSAPALRHLLAVPDRSLIGDAIVAQTRGMLASLAAQLAEAFTRSAGSEALREALLARLLADADLSTHCHALAIEWRLAQGLENDIALDPVLSPQLQAWVGQGEAAIGSLAMAALAAQARFAQGQRRVELPLSELPGELFHAALAAAQAGVADNSAASDPHAEARLRAAYDEAGTRAALFSRLARETPADARKTVVLEQAGVALWLSVVATRSGQPRERIAAAAANPHLGRLLLCLRAAGIAPNEAERQALRLQPDAAVPPGIVDVGTREAAQWLAEVRA